MTVSMPSASPPPGKPSSTQRRRAPRRGATPTISVVVASCRAPALLDACLGSLRGQCEQMGAQLIVARSAYTGDVGSLAKAYPDVEFIEAPSGASIPELRGIGMAQAAGDIVALTEDHCVADEHWLESIAQQAGDGAHVIGGGMGNAQRDRTIDWAAYFSEYGFFAPGRPTTENAVPLLTGANVAYTRDVIDDVIDWARQGEWENVAHDRLFARGSVLRFARTAAISQNQQYAFRGFCHDRYEHGRDYARKRLAEESGARRWLLFAATPLLPVVLSWRVARAVGSAHRKPFLRALPVTFVFFAWWAAGEAVGYLRGLSKASGTP